MSAPFGNPDEGRGLAARVILHLSRLGPLRPNDIASLEYTQTGMVATLGVRQGSLTKVLQRLRAGDAVTVERRYVAGGAQRLKVYCLTGLGESLAKDLRHHAPPPAASPPPTGPWLFPPAPTLRGPAEREGSNA